MSARACQILRKVKKELSFEIFKIFSQCYLGSYINPKPLSVFFSLSFVSFSPLLIERRGVSGTTRYTLFYDDYFDDERVFDRRWWWLWSGFFLFFFSLLLLCGKDGGIDFAIIIFDDECDEEEAV